MQERRVVKPGLLLAMVWGVVLLMTLYGPDVVRDASEKSDTLREQAWLQSALETAGEVSETIGLARLRSGLGELRASINEPRTVLAYEEPDVPIEPPPPTTTATQAAGAASEGLVHIFPKRPRRVLVVGASSIQFAIGVELERRMPTFEGVKVKRFGQLATGLSRPDFFDWPAKVESLATSFKPDLIIANYGGNGAQAIPIGGGKKVRFKTPEWDAEYGRRVAELVAIAERHGAEMVFMGMPTMRSKKFTAKMRYLNRVQKQAAEAAGAMFVSTFEMAAKPDGSYRKSLRYRGKRGLMRTSDGVHYSKLGAKYVVEQVLQAVERRYHLVPPEAERGIAEGHAFVSEVASSTVAYTAYLPREAAAGAGTKKAAILLLPDAGEDWFTWPKHPHRTLQALAQKHGVVLLVPADSDSAAHLAGAHHNGHGPNETVFAELKKDVGTHLPVSELTREDGVSAKSIEPVVQATLPPPPVEPEAPAPPP